MKRIFVTATNTDIGKTYTTQKLLVELASRGLSVGVFKPIETGVIDGYAPDGSLLLELLHKLNSKCRSLHVEDIVPITYELPSAPFIASNNTKLDLEKISKALHKLEELCDVVIIEGAGGLLVPIDEEYMMIDLIEYFKAKTLLVTHCSLGCINDTLLSSELLKNRELSHVVAFNHRDNYEEFTKVSKPYFLHKKIPILRVNEDISDICNLLLI